MFCAVKLDGTPVSNTTGEFCRSTPFIRVARADVAANTRASESKNILTRDYLASCLEVGSHCETERQRPNFVIFVQAVRI